MKRLISSLRASKTESLARKHSFKPSMEGLEARWCPSATVGLQNGILTITGDDNANIVQIVQNDNQNKLTVIADGVQTDFASDQVLKVVANLKGGDDLLTYQLGGGSDFKKAKDIQIDLGAGNDRANLDFASNGAGGQAEIEKNLNINVLGQAGNDQLDAFFGKVENVAVNLTGNMGFGDDKFFAELKGDLDFAAKVKIDMEDVNNVVLPIGGLNRVVLLGGNDQFRVKADADVDIDDNAALDVTLKGFDGIDNLSVTTRGEVDGQLKVLLDGEDGGDLVLADITLDAGSDGTVDAKVLGGNDNDIVALRIIDNSNGQASLVQALLDGGAGDNDGCVKTANVLDINCEVVVLQ